MTHKTKTILCYGDSNTFGFDPSNCLRYPEDIRWPGVLREILGDGYRIIEEGCNGRTVAYAPLEESWKDGRPYLKACLNSHKPLDAIVLMLGSNDLKKEFNATPESIAGGIGEMLHTMADFLEEKQGSVPYILVVSPPEIKEGVFSAAFGPEFDMDGVIKSRALGAAIEMAAFEYAQSTENPCGFLDAARIVQPSAEDSLHLSPEGHRTLANAIAQTLKAFL